MRRHPDPFFELLQQRRKIIEADRGWEFVKRLAPTRGGRVSRKGAFRRFLFVAVFLPSVFLPGLPLRAQVTESGVRRSDIPFEKWMEEGKREEIRWSVRISRPRLANTQRFIVRFTVSLDGKRVAESGPTHDFVLMAAFRQREIGWLENRGMVGARFDAPPPRNMWIDLNMQAFVLPGDYTVGVVLYDRVTKNRSVCLQPLHVSSLYEDPLPNAFRNLPRVEFIQSEQAFLTGTPKEMTSQLFLPVPTRRPICVEALFNYTPSFEYMGQKLPQKQVIALMTGMLHVISQMGLPNGTLNLTALDLSRRTVIFEQRDVHGLDFEDLRNALAGINEGKVDVRDLKNRFASGTFFREALAAKLAPPARVAAVHPGDDAAGPASDPFRVILVVSTPVLFERHTDLSPLKPVADCNCRIYHIRYRTGPQNAWDELSRIINPLRPRRFDVDSPESFRRAFAQIITELQKL